MVTSTIEAYSSSDDDSTSECSTFLPFVFDMHAWNENNEQKYRLTKHIVYIEQQWPGNDLFAFDYNLRSRDSGLTN